MKTKSLHITFFILTFAILNCTGPPAAYAYDPMCEFYEEHNGVCCSDCHDMVSCATTNLFCVPSPISTPNSGEKPVVYDSLNSQVRGTEPYDGVCEVCHTGTKYHRNNASGDHTHCVGQKCTSCHLHGPTTMVSKSLCYTCHGGAPGDVPAGNPPMFTVPCLSGPSHDTHTQANAKGPAALACSVCHVGGVYDIDDMDLGAVCGDCHSPDGAFDGINDPTIGVKANWAEGVYEADGKTLKSGKERWCIGCHDGGTSVCDSVSAPDIGGDGSTYGYYVNGHKSRLCSECHDLTVAHIDGKARTYAFNSAYYDPNQSGVAYASGYRLRYVGSEVPLMIPANHNITFGYNAQLIKANAFRLCFDCHDSSKIFDDTPGDGLDTNFKASLPNPPRDYSYAWGSGADINEHVAHILNYTGPFWDSDWDTGTNGAGGSNGRDSLTACPVCHNVHGAAGSQGSTNEPMIRDGNLAGRTGYGFSYVVEDSAGYPMVTSTGATLPISVGAIFRNSTANMCAGSICHGNPDPPPASSYDATGSSGGTYVEYYRATVTSNCSLCHAYGTDGSHPTHDNSTGKGVDLGCYDCHNSGGHMNNTVDFADGNPLSATSACDNCHSEGGAYKGVTMAKANWTMGIYEEDGKTLKSGKEQWCATCHDDAPANSKKDGSGIAAPNVIGDNSTYGFYVTGHKISCTNCHDPGKGHIDGEHRTYEVQEGDPQVVVNPYCDSYRLKDVKAQPAMNIPRPKRSTSPRDVPDDFALCFDCHNLYEVVGTAWDDESHTNFWDDQNSYQNHEFDRNEHNYHLKMDRDDFDSDWDGTGDSEYSCIACHNVHGAPNQAMIRHGELISSYGTSDKVPALNFAYLVPPTEFATATWSFSGSSDSYYVYARWTSDPEHPEWRASNAKYTLNYNGGSVSFTKNQQIDGGTWNQLGTGTYSFGAGNSVVLSNEGADSSVVADAIGWDRNGVFVDDWDTDGVPDPEIVVDNIDATYTPSVSDWSSSSYVPGYHGTNYQSHDKPPESIPDSNGSLQDSLGGKMDSLISAVCASCHGSISYYRTPNLGPKVIYPRAEPESVDNDGTAEVLLVAHVLDKDDNLKATDPVVIDLSSIGGSNAQPMFDNGTNGDQQPNDGIFSYRTTVPESVELGYKTLLVTATDQDELTSQGDIVLKVTSPSIVIIDNSEWSFTEYDGTWTTSSYASGYYGTNYQYHAEGVGSDYFKWTPTITTPGLYTVYARYPEWQSGWNWATDATYTIYHDGGSTPVSVNQRENGGTWVSLGTYSVDGTDDYVKLNQNPTGIVIADAIRWELQL